MNRIFNVLFVLILMLLSSCFSKINEKQRNENEIYDSKAIDTIVNRNSLLNNEALYLISIGYPDLTLKDVISRDESCVYITYDNIMNSTIQLNSKIFKVNYGMRLEDIKFVDSSTITIDENGYSYYEGVTYKFSNGLADDKWLLLYGGEFFVDTIYTQNEKKWFRDLSDSVINVYNYSHDTHEKEMPSYFFVDDGIEYISAWSELKDIKESKTVVYSINGVRDPFIYGGFDVIGIELNQTTLPWAEGVNGSGIGGIIDISFDRDSDKIIILNGYVDLTRQDLYKKNNRLKTIEIKSIKPEFSITYNFDDVVKFHEVLLPDLTDEVKIIIKDVYLGTLYDDTCITKIFLPQKELRPRSEYEKVIEDTLKEVGFLISDH